MQTTLKATDEYTSFESTIRFYSLEINFLLKTLTKEYGVFSSKEKIKKLDTFWKAFEKFSKRLKDLSDERKQAELDQTILELYPNTIQNSSLENSWRKYFMAELSCVLYELQTLKNALYDYLENPEE
ncbi:MAG TPA: hypothetical protein VNB90_12020 [Cytophagaceae bacterium]|jgi:hypothetical protein|nr:hypothetical protein [Cytophagaceae bacterium]